MALEDPESYFEALATLEGPETPEDDQAFQPASQVSVTEPSDVSSDSSVLLSPHEIIRLKRRLSNPQDSDRPITRL